MARSQPGSTSSRPRRRERSDLSAKIETWIAALTDWLSHRPPARAAAAAVLALVLISVNSSVGADRVSAAIPKDLQATYSPQALKSLAGRMDRAAFVLASRHEPWASRWQPGGPLGWPVYDIEVQPSLLRRTLDADEARKLNDLIPISELAYVMSPFSLTGGSTAERERAVHCLTQAIYYEAANESDEGQQAVAQVVLNRLRHPAYPKSLCGVVYQGSQRTTGCQFSFTCDGSLRRAPAQWAWQRAERVAREALLGKVYAPVGTATHYHANYVFPYWAVTLVKLRQIGAHIFYRMTGPAGVPEAFNGRYAGGELSLSAAVLRGGDARTPDAPSAVLDDPAAAQNMRVVTLTIAGESRSYTVADGLPAPVSAQAGPAPILLSPSRRQPTPDEVRAINEKLLRFEDMQKSGAKHIAAPAEGPVSTAPAAGSATPARVTPAAQAPTIAVPAPAAEG